MKFSEGSCILLEIIVDQCTFMLRYLVILSIVEQQDVKVMIRLKGKGRDVRLLGLPVSPYFGIPHNGVVGGAVAEPDVHV